MYCTLQEVKDEFAGITIASSGTKMTESQVNAWVAQESAFINSCISNRYRIPVVEATSPISFLVLKRIALYRVSERIKNKIEIKTSVEQTSSEEKSFVQTKTPNSDLKDIASGKIDLPDAELISSGGSVYSHGCEGYFRTDEQQW